MIVKIHLIVSYAVQVQPDSDQHSLAAALPASEIFILRIETAERGWKMTSAQQYSDDFQVQSTFPRRVEAGLEMVHVQIAGPGGPR